ncbi:MAG: sialidase family protein [Armatimonadota bacterium]
MNDELRELWHHEAVEICTPQTDHDFVNAGGTVDLDDGRVMLIYAGPVNVHGQAPGASRVYGRISEDGCKTWGQEREIIHHPECQAAGGTPLRAEDGTVWIFYLGFYASVWEDDQPNMDKTRSDLWAVRSTDEGATVGDRQVIFRGYTGATNDAVELSTGRLVVPFSYLVTDPGRLVSVCVVSDDGGKTWRQGASIDIGQHGDHAGALEPVVQELRDGRLWMLIRTNLGYFMQSFSDDGGLTWEEPQKTQFESPSSPCHLTRLQSGRLAIIWNNTMQTTGIRSSFHMALSEDDGETWTDPVEVLRAQEDDYPQVSYPYIGEHRPGVMTVSCKHVQQGWNIVRPVVFQVPEDALLK